MKLVLILFLSLMGICFATDMSDQICLVDKITGEVCEIRPDTPANRQTLATIKNDKYYVKTFTTSQKFICETEFKKWDGSKVVENSELKVKKEKSVEEEKKIQEKIREIAKTEIAKEAIIE